MIEKKGGFSDRCELNRQIRKDNDEILYLKSLIEKLKRVAISLADTMVDTVTDIARKIEMNRQNLITGYYLLTHYDRNSNSDEQYIAWVDPLLSEYMGRHDKLRKAIETGNELKEELVSLSPLHVLKHRDLSSEIETLNEKIRKTKSKQAAIRDKCGKSTHADMKELLNLVSELKAKIQRHPEKTAQRQSAISSVIQTLRDLYSRAKAFDPFTLMAERKKIRAAFDSKGKERIKEMINRNPDPELYKQSADKADEVIDDLDIEFIPAVKEKPPRSKEQKQVKEPQKSKSRREKGPEMAL